MDKPTPREEIREFINLQIIKIIEHNYERWVVASDFFKSDESTKLRKNDLTRYKLYLEEYSRITGTINEALVILKERVSVSEYLSMLDKVERSLKYEYST